MPVSKTPSHFKKYPLGLEKVKTEEVKLHQKMPVKLFGNLSERDNKRVWDGWAKHSHFGESIDDQLNISFSKLVELHNEQEPNLSKKVHNHDYDPNEEHFSDEDQVNSNEEDNEKILNYVKSFEKKLSGISLWLAHGILGFVPIMLTGNKMIYSIIAVTISTIFMITMFIRFIHSKGLIFMFDNGISLSDIEEDSDEMNEQSPMKRLNFNSKRTRKFTCI